MSKAALSLERVYFDPALEETPWGLRALEAFASFRPEPRERESLKEELLFGCQDPLAEGKKVLLLSPYPGQLVKRCPGTKGYTCCGYWVINALLNCPMDCSYCILQGYLQEPYIVLNLPLDKAFEEVRRLLDLRPRHILRLGTGELSDSLALDPWIGFNQEAISFFSRLEGALLELKTKAQEVDHLLGLDHRSRTVISWSLNPQRIVEKEEIHTAPLRQRLEAARRCQEAGYPLGFHFDPIIEYPGWEEDYRGLIEELFRHVDPRGVIWISLGTLRYPPGLERVIRKRFPATEVLQGELLPAEDGKFRYLKPLRIGIYRRVVSWLREHYEDLFIYLCMEREDVWQEVFGRKPGGTAALMDLFDSKVREFFRRW